MNIKSVAYFDATRTRLMHGKGFLYSVFTSFGSVNASNRVVQLQLHSARQAYCQVLWVGLQRHPQCLAFLGGGLGRMVAALEWSTCTWCVCDISNSDIPKVVPSSLARSGQPQSTWSCVLQDAVGWSAGRPLWTCTAEHLVNMTDRCVTSLSLFNAHQNLCGWTDLLLGRNFGDGA